MHQIPVKPYWQQVKGNTWCMVFDFGRIPVYLLGDGRAIMLDSGFPQNRQEILDLLAEKDLRLAALLTTHTHPDHIGNHTFLRERFGAKVYMTAFAAITCIEPLAMGVSLGGRAAYRSIKERIKDTAVADVTIPFEEGEILVEGAAFRVIPTPGHCVEHVSFITPDNVAYVGDALQSEDFMINRRLTYCTGLEEDLESKARIAKLDCDCFILSHNGVVESVKETVETAVEAMEYRLALFEQLADTPAGEDELVRRFLVHTGADLENTRSVRGVHFNALAFIAYLVDTGRLTTLVEDGYVKYVRPKKTDS